MYLPIRHTSLNVWVNSESSLSVIVWINFQKHDRLLREKKVPGSSWQRSPQIYQAIITRREIVNYYWLYSMTVVCNIILVDDTVRPLVRINNILCSSCTQLQKSNQIQNLTTSKVIHHIRSGQINLFWSSRMASKCEQAWHSCQQDTRLHIPSHRPVNKVSSLSLLGIEPVSRLLPDWTEWWQANVSTRDNHPNKKNQSTYQATVEPMTKVLQVLQVWLELNRLVD
jgi:hypothetical protein